MSETFVKYPKIRQLGAEENALIFVNPVDDIVVEEKVDGANFRFMFDKHGRIIFGSRTQSLGDDSQDIGGNWKRCVLFIKDKFSKVMIPPYSKIFYGECMVKHSMNYDWDRVPPYLGFDILDIESNKFLDYGGKKEIFEIYELPIVPLVKICKAQDLTELGEKDIPASAYRDGKAEGIVFKNYDKQIFGKIVTDEFKEANREHFGGGKKFAENDDERIVAMFCTNARIDKAIFKLMDEGHKLDMPLMSVLPSKVIEDIYEECWREICFSSWSVNFKGIRKLVAKRCLSVLKQMVINNSLQMQDGSSQAMAV